MAGMGPPPKDASQRARRNPSVAMTALPAEGRKGRAPAWPLIDDLRLSTQIGQLRAALLDLEILADDPDLNPRQRGRLDQRLAMKRAELEVVEAKLAQQKTLEADTWKRMWRTPQAAQWERLRWERDVAFYVRHSVLAELGSLDDLKEARQWSDRLGLTPMSMLRLRWQVQDAPAAAAAAAPARSGSRARYGHLRAVGGAGSVGA